MSSKNTSAEIHRFERRYAAEPGSLVFARLADAYRRAGQLDRGLQVVEEGLAKHPDYLSAHLVHARILRKLERPEAAADAVERALRLDEQNLVALRARAELAVELTDTATAEKCYERILEIEPFDHGVRDALRHIRSAAEPEPSEEPAGQVEQGEPTPVEEDHAAAHPSEAWLASLDESPLALPATAAAAAAEESGTEEMPETEPEPEAAARHEPEPEPAPEPEPELAPEPEPAHQLMTATMAELYLKQGLYEEAIRVYERLLESSPGDFRLIEKLKAAHLLSERGPTIKKRAEQPASRPPTPDEEASGPEHSEEIVRDEEAERDEEATAEAPAPQPARAPEDRRQAIRSYLASLLEAAGVQSDGLDPEASPRFEAWLQEREEQEEE